MTVRRKLYKESSVMLTDSLDHMMLLQIKADLE